MIRLRLLAFALALLSAVAPRSSFSATSVSASVREPAVAGLFYPGQPAVLAKLVDTLLANATTERGGELKALICPHAGYPYSGPVAASGFHLLQGLHFDTVVALGPAHYAALNEASVASVSWFRTPLGDVPVSPKAAQLAQHAPFAQDPRCYVERPEWAGESSRPIPPSGTDRADTWEHSVEVEVPFLQQSLHSFAILPVVMGEADPADAARALGPYLDDTTLLVVSSDLSHYHPYAEAQRLDRRCVDAILALDTRKMSGQEACGRIPILTLLHLAKERGWRPQLLDLRNSGDTTGDKSRVVGYAAIAFYAPAATAVKTAAQTPPSKEGAISPADRQFLLTLARQAVRTAVTTGTLPQVDETTVGGNLKAAKGTFVTLTKHGELRGCIGNITPGAPLYRAVAENARHAALEDPRFPPVTSREIDDLEIEISVLTEPQPLAFTSPSELLRKLNPGRDGVVLRIGAGVATYLPQVWEQLPDKVEFLNSLARKAGGSEDDWRQPGTTVAIYHVESFHESGRDAGKR